MKNHKLISLLLVPTLIGLSSNVDAISARTVGGNVGNDDVSMQPTQIEGSRSIFDIIGFVNGYLRFAIGFVCFLFMIWNGYQLIMARGNEKDMEAAKNALIGCGIGLVSCFLAYIIVNIAVKLFR